jgi:hypothetical protein
MSRSLSMVRSPELARTLPAGRDRELNQVHAEIVQFIVEFRESAISQSSLGSC